MTASTSSFAAEQVNLAYDKTQDRLLLRVRWSDGDVAGFWLTRRLTQSLLPALVTLLGTSHVATDAASRRELLAYDHRRSLETADFGQAFKGEGRPRFPGGRLLAEVVNLHTLAGGKGWRIELRGAGDVGASFDLDRKAMHSIVKMLNDVLANSGWDLRQAEVQGATDSSGQVVH